jgi:hypothetical protein
MSALLSLILLSSARPPFPIFLVGRYRGLEQQERSQEELTQLDNVANNTHDQETHADGLRDAQELALVGCTRMSAKVHERTLSLSREEKGEKGRERGHEAYACCTW